MGTKRYSEEFKREALDAYKQLGSAKAAGELVGCSHFAILQWAKKANCLWRNVSIMEVQQSAPN